MNADCGHGEVIASLQDCWNVTRDELAEANAEIARLTAELGHWQRVFGADAFTLVQRAEADCNEACALAERYREFMLSARATLQDAENNHAKDAEWKRQARAALWVLDRALLVEHNEETP